MSGTDALLDCIDELKAKLAEEQRISTMRGNMIEFELIPALAYAEARADLPPTREQIMADPRVMALVEALHVTAEKLSLVMRAGKYGEATQNQALSYYRTALAALKATETDNEGETE